jgi:hypothetical protein
MLANANVLQVGVALCCTIISIGIAGYMIGLGIQGKRLEEKDK